MDIITASQILIVVTIIILAYNLYQFFLSHNSIQNQVDEFLEVVGNDALSTTGFNSLNTVVYLVLPVVYVGLLYLANFSYVILAVVGVKMFVGSFLSHWMQNEILEIKTFPQKFYLINKIDHTINALIMSLILYFVFI